MRVGFFALLLWLVLGPVLLSFAAAATPEDADKDLYQFNWLDPEKKIYVLQNRQFVKARRFAVFGMLGTSLSETYRDTWDLDGRASYFFTENLGVEVFFQKFFNQVNNASRALLRASSTALPVIRETRTAVGGLFVWAPFYAKINVFNKILYFDWLFSAGLGRVGTAIDTNTIVGGASKFVAEDRTAFFWGTGHQFFIDDHWLFRMDFIAAHFRALSFGTTGEQTWFSNYNFRIGAGYRF